MKSTHQIRPKTPSRSFELPLEGASDVPLAREVIDDRYLVHDVIGEGGMAVVVAATHMQLDMAVALKFLRSELRDEPDLLARFLEEGRASARIKSEHVARVHDVGVCSYGPYLVMEHLRGRDLATVIHEDGPLPVERAIDYVLQACEAIAEAHALGVIHRDLKPANLFLTTSEGGGECIKVLDFGISKLMGRRSGPSKVRATDPCMLMGTPPYMSPEQASSAGDVDARTDIWALGATLHELLTGEPPFGDGPLHTLWFRAANKRRTPVSTIRSDVPRALEAAIARCLAVDVRERYASVADLARAIAECSRFDTRRSAGRMARISGIGSGWEVAPQARTAGPLRAKDLLEEAPKEGASGGRWTGFALAAAVMGLSTGFVVTRYNAAFRAETRTLASFAAFERKPALFVAPVRTDPAPGSIASIASVPSSVPSAWSTLALSADAGAPPPRSASPTPIP
jgi:eukaryotic-like serine/threonine-protein kinase